MKTAKPEIAVAGNRWCAAHADERDCNGDRKDVSIAGTRYLMCRKGRMGLRAKRAARTKAFKSANMDLPL